MAFYWKLSIFLCEYVASVLLPNFRVGGVTLNILYYVDEITNKEVYLLSGIQYYRCQYEYM